MAIKEDFHNKMATLLFCKTPAELTYSRLMTKESGNIDSMAETEIVYLVEDTFNIIISFDELKACTTYGSLIELLAMKGAQLA